MDSEIEKARVPSDFEREHPTLFPLSEYTGRRRTSESICRDIGLNRLTALKLHENGWLSFDPRSDPELTRSQEAEITFLGALVTAGCDESLLKHLLSGLRKPYSYSINRMYYDWVSRAWRLLEDAGDLDASFEEWLMELVAWRELERLERMKDQMGDAIAELRASRKAAGPDVT